jgi:hypothetical protein
MPAAGAIVSPLERVDIIVIAGDLRDGDWPDYNTGAPDDDGPER